MRAVHCKEFGGPETLVIEEAETQKPGPSQMRIAVRAAGVNFADLLMISGHYQHKPPFPFAPGLELAGEVIECGKDARRAKVGDRVMAGVTHGAYAEEAVAEDSRVFPIPDSMSFEIAAGFMVAYGTSHVGLGHRVGLKKGETLLVHGASGGVGLTAVEIGTVMGATVIAAASSPEKLKVAASRGAEHLIDYSHEDVRERVKKITGGRGADVIYDPVGGDAFDASLRCINWEGRILVIGFASGKIPKIPANILLVKNVSAVGFYWGAYMQKDPQVIYDSFAELFEWFESGRLRPHISDSFAMDDAASALKLVQSRHSTGKVVLTMGN